MSVKQELNDMLDNLINNKPEDAQVNFHSYLKGKMQDVIGNTSTSVSSSKDSVKDSKERN